MTLSTWKEVCIRIGNPTTEPGETVVGQQKITEYTTMPVTQQEEEDSTLSIEEAHDHARDNAPYSGVSRETLGKIERLTPERRYEWKEEVDDIGDPSAALVTIHLHDDFPHSAVSSIRHPTDWETLDPGSISSVECSISGVELWEVEMDSPRFAEDSNVSYVDESGHEYGGFYISGEGSEWEDVSSDSDEFISQQAANNVSLNNNQSTSLVSFLPEEGEKIHVEARGTVLRDMSYDDRYEDVVSVEEYPEIKSIMESIILGESDNEVLADWVPLEARSEEGGQTRAMQEKVEEITETTVGEYYLDVPLIACEINTGAASGKRYVAVPEEEADELDELLFDPDLY